MSVDPPAINPTEVGFGFVHDEASDDMVFMPPNGLGQYAGTARLLPDGRVLPVGVVKPGARALAEMQCRAGLSRHKTSEQVRALIA